MKVHLVDGTFELFRAYFGAPSATSPGGMEVGATRGLMRSLSALASQKDVTHIACAFDSVVESFRNDLFDGYKTGEGMEPDLYAQFPLAERAIAALGITVWGMREFEADDAIAAGAAKYGADSRVEQVVLCSPDKDLTQCVIGDRIVTHDRLRDRWLDESGVHEKFGVAPKSIPDYLALVGDTADGIPGIPRWGAKSTATVLSHYGRLEAIPDAVDEWAIEVRGAAALAKNLATARDEAALYKRLATLRTDVPLSESLDDLHYTGPADTLWEICDELGESVERFERLSRLTQP